MWETGPRNQNFGVETFGFRDLATVHWNPVEPMLYEHALTGGEASIASGGALRAETGKHTGRSPKDKFIVFDDRTKDLVWWENNGRMKPEQFSTLHADFIEHARGKQLYVQDLYAGAEPVHRLSTRVYTELAWQSLFIRNLLIRPQRDELSCFVPRFTIACFPSFKADPSRHGVRTETVIAIDFTRQVVLIGGTSICRRDQEVDVHGDELLPPAAGRAADALLRQHRRRSGTRRSFSGCPAPARPRSPPIPTRTLIGDDEHGWSDARRLQLRRRLLRQGDQPHRRGRTGDLRRTRTFGTVLENVVFDASARRLDFDDAALTENTRAAYPLDYIPNALRHGAAATRSTSSC